MTTQESHTDTPLSLDTALQNILYASANYTLGIQSLEKPEHSANLQSFFLTLVAQLTKKWQQVNNTDKYLEQLEAAIIFLTSQYSSIENLLATWLDNMVPITPTAAEQIDDITHIAQQEARKKEIRSLEGERIINHLHKQKLININLAINYASKEYARLQFRDAVLAIFCAALAANREYADCLSSYPSKQVLNKFTFMLNELTDSLLTQWLTKINQNQSVELIWEAIYNHNPTK